MIYYPRHWMEGELLDVQNTGQGYEIRRMQDYGKQVPAGVKFDNAFDTQRFVSNWYAPGLTRQPGIYEPQPIKAEREQLKVKHARRQTARI